MKFINFVSVIAIFCLISLCLALKRKSRKRKTKTNPRPATYLKINNGWLAQCKASGCVINIQATKFICPHSDEACQECILNNPEKKLRHIDCTSCFSVYGAAAGCFDDVLLNKPKKNGVKIVNSGSGSEDPDQFTIIPTGAVEQPVLQAFKQPEEEKKGPVVNPDAFIQSDKTIRNAFIILDATGSMNSKKNKLISEINTLNESAKVTYCYEDSNGIHKKTLEIASTSNKINLNFIEGYGTVNFKGCLNKLQESTEPYDLIYIIGDGDFEKNLTKNDILEIFKLSLGITKKATLIYKKSTLKKEESKTNFEDILEGAGFTVNKIEI